jgi:UDP-glucose 4-epimerase
LPFGDDRSDEIDLSSPYAVDKYALEQYAAVAHSLYGTPSIGLRFFNVYGPKQDPNSPYAGVIALFIDRLARNKPITVYGGYQTRDFVFVADVATVLYHSMTHLQRNGGRSVFNVATGKSVTIDELLHKLASALQTEPQVAHEALPAGDPAVSLGSSARMAQELSLDVERFTPLETGLLATLRYATSSGG